MTLILPGLFEVVLLWALDGSTWRPTVAEWSNEADSALECAMSHRDGPPGGAFADYDWTVDAGWLSPDGSYALRHGQLWFWQRLLSPLESVAVLAGERSHGIVVIDCGSFALGPCSGCGTGGLLGAVILRAIALESPELFVFSVAAWMELMKEAPERGVGWRVWPPHRLSTGDLRRCHRSLFVHRAARCWQRFERLL